MNQDDRLTQIDARLARLEAALTPALTLDSLRWLVWPHAPGVWLARLDGGRPALVGVWTEGDALRVSLHGVVGMRDMVRVYPGRGVVEVSDDGRAWEPEYRRVEYYPVR